MMFNAMVEDFRKYMVECDSRVKREFDLRLKGIEAERIACEKDVTRLRLEVIDLKKERRKIKAELDRIDNTVKHKLEWCAKNGIMFVGEV